MEPPDATDDDTARGETLLPWRPTTAKEQDGVFIQQVLAIKSNTTNVQFHRRGAEQRDRCKHTYTRDQIDHVTTRRAHTTATAPSITGTKTWGTSEQAIKATARHTHVASTARGPEGRSWPRVSPRWLFCRCGSRSRSLQPASYRCSTLWRSTKTHDVRCCFRFYALTPGVFLGLVHRCWRIAALHSAQNGIVRCQQENPLVQHSLYQAQPTRGEKEKERFSVFIHLAPSQIFPRASLPTMSFVPRESAANETLKFVVREVFRATSLPHTLSLSSPYRQPSPAE